MMGLAIAHGWIAGLSQAATGSLVTAVWQGILLVAAAGLGLRLLPKTPAAVRFAIWFAVFVVVTALPVVSLWPHTGGAEAAGSHGPWFTVDARWSLAIAAVWAVASLVRAGTLAAAALRVRALWKRATPVGIEALHPGPGLKLAMNGATQQETNAGILRSAQNDKSKVGSRRAQICTSDEVDRPTVIGFSSPKILIPVWLLEKLTAAELEQIVLHEAGHLGRADDWMNLLQKIALVVFPLNPALAWVERRLCFERELAVDERVLQAFAGRAGAAKAYAACLATLAEYRLGRRALALALGALGRESELGRRVGRILRREVGMKPLHSRLVLGGAMLGLLAAATGLERCPQVVGFADDGSQAVAVAQRRIPTHGDETAMNGAPGVKGFRAISVVYKANQKREIQPIVGATHETLAVAPDASRRQSAELVGADKVQQTVERGADGSARMMQTAASASLDSKRHPTLSDETGKDGPPRFVEAQWVVVTTWQGGQGTRMVFATEKVFGTTGQETAADFGTIAGEQSVPMEQAPRYAAVPVRGGWIVFQL
jgi:Zn-dependent protease with chaperone function